MVYKQHEISGRTLTNKEKKVVEQISNVIPKVEEAIMLAKAGKLIDGNKNQLIKIENELQKMNKTLNPKLFMPGFGHAIADSWNSDSELGNELLDVIYYYKKL